MSDFSEKAYKNKTGESEVEIDTPEFDITFQAGLLKLALKDDYFCGQLVKYLKDEDLEQYVVFDSSELHSIFKWICESIEKYKTRPTEAQLRTAILEFQDDEREPYFAALDMIMGSDIHNEDFFRQHMTAFVQQVKMAKGFKKTRSIWKERPLDAHEHMQKVIDSIRRVQFEQEDILHLRNIHSLVQKDLDKSEKIPTGLIKLDEDLRGGFPREILVTVLGASNAGKSLFCSSLACSALRAGFRVLHINLEGTRDETVYKYIANLADIPFWKIEEQKLTEVEKTRVDEIIKSYDQKLRIRNMLNFGVTIEDVISYCREAYKDFPFDMLVVDYGQLLKVKSNIDKFERQTEVYRGLDSIGKEFHCVVVSPAQATREGIRKQNEYGKFKNKGADEKLPVLRSDDLADCIEIARVSAVIITLNRTEEEETRGWVRVFLEKQRRGKKAITYGVKAKYDRSNLVINDYYEPNSLIHKSESKDDEAESKDNSETGLKKTSEEKKDIFEKKHTINKIAKETSNADELAYNELLLEYEQLVEEKKVLDDKLDKEKDFSLTQELAEKQFKNRERRMEIKEVAKEMLYKFMPQASAELYSETKKSLKDLLSVDGVKPENLLKTQLILSQLALVFEQ